MVSLLHAVLVANSLVAPHSPDEIVGGTPTAPGEFESVVAVYTGGEICSGTLVAPDIVLTAAHCVDGRTPDAIRVDGGTEASYVASVPALAIGVHPLYCRTCEPSDPDIFDYGYVRIDGTALGITELAQPLVTQEDWDAAIHRGSPVTIVGYGADELGVTGIKRKVDTSITAQSSTGLEFRAGGNFRDSCGGDSGGPAFVEIDGQWLQAGVVSRGSQLCGRGGTYAATYPALAWLQAETGVPFCGAECGECDCLDTTPRPEPESCACSHTRADEFLWLFVLLGALSRRRRPAHVTAGFRAV